MNSGAMFAIIPNFVIENFNLSGLQLRTYALISQLCNKNGYCYASNKYIAERLKTSSQCISKVISDLVDFILIKSDYNLNTGERKIYLNLNFKEFESEAEQKSDLNAQKHALNQRESIDTIKDTTKEPKRVKTQEKAVFSLTLKTKAKIQNLSDKYRQELMAKIEQYQRENPSAMSYDEFANQCEANGYTYANFWLAYLNWEKMRKERKSAQRNSAQSLQERNFQVMAEWAREMEEKERSGEMIETELLNEF